MIPHVGVQCYDDLEKIIDMADGVVDFSTTESSMTVLKSCIRHKKALMLGTTGFSEEQTANPYEPEKHGAAALHAVVLSFRDIDSVMEFAWSIGGEYPGKTALYRPKGSAEFYLVLEKPNDMENDQFLHFLNGLTEYADLVPASGTLYGYLTEHETPVMDDAVRKLAGC